MGTRSRSVTIVMNDNQELCRIYRQFDGYPEGHGLELAKLCNVRITNGISKNGVGTANGMGCLAAQIVMGLKHSHKVGGIYLEPPNGPINDWVEYIYIVRGSTGNKPIIECTTKTGEWPFNVQDSEGHVFTGNAQQWKMKYEKETAE